MAVSVLPKISQAGGSAQAGSHVIRLRDGRRLAYSELGDPDGVPIIHQLRKQSDCVERGAKVMGNHRCKIGKFLVGAFEFLRRQLKRQRLMRQIKHCPGSAAN